MQAMLYYDVRSRFGLSANLAQQAFRRVAANRKAARAQGEAAKAFDATSVQYDQRIFSFREQDWTVSLTLLHGRVRDRYSRLRGGLQQKASKGTRSTRRRCRELLARLSGREQRFQRWLNHGISKEIVQDAQATGAMVVLEDLTGIRERTNGERRNRTERRRGNSWAFFQLRQFLTYKAALAAVPVVLHPPAYTSQMCHGCLRLGHRAGKRFVCQNPRCGWSGDADFNAAKNLETLGLNVSQTRGPWVHSPWSGEPTGLLKSPCL